MGQRITVGALLGTLAAGALAALAPSAAAQDLAPGVSCDAQGYCHNDTDDIYYITGQVSCSDLSTGPFSGYVDRHSATMIALLCPDDSIPGTMEQGPPTIGPDGTMQPGMMTQSPSTTTINDVVSIQWQTATVDNDRKLGPHGSLS
ncbi:hypothetical protein [Nocardia stercoris]|uniref:Uncharacterized protein n=1 Tax=Nocardia stercoris TaxID=2483361 RepID=A0A3M2LCQ4_9NOCA|nr:hypothetical protein [Nocardia stercoris]RMI35311.1 hypothetical protein EBN03_03245 [Nocardia stercoris]